MFSNLKYKAVLDLFFPPLCPLCRKEWAIADIKDLVYLEFCNECKQKLICEFENFCPKCGLPVGKETNSVDCKTCRGRTIHYDQLLFVNEYKTYIGELIVNFKYRKDTLLAHFFGCWIYEKIKTQYTNIDVIVPVPMYWLKKIKRGYNQAEMLGLELSHHLNIPMKTNILKRSKSGENQAGQSRTIRYKGVKELYFVNRKYNFKNILLIDDVVTTGSTLSECAKVLKESGCEKVFCATIAGVHRDK